MSANRSTEKTFLEGLAEAGADVSTTPKIGDTVSRKTAPGTYRAGEFVSLDHAQNLGVFQQATNGRKVEFAFTGETIDYQRRVTGGRFTFKFGQEL